MSDLVDPRIHPHVVPWFFKLMSMFQRPAHPVAWDVDPDALSTDLDPGAFSESLKLTTDRRRRMEIFEEMDTFGLVSSILEIFAEESTQPDYDKGRRVWVESSNVELIKAANGVFDNCMVEERIPAVSRRLYKFGDSFQRLVYQTGKGVLGWRNATPKDVNRWEDKHGRLIGFSEKNTAGKSKKFRGKDREESWPWDYIHFRILGRDESELYGTSHLQAMFRPWRQLALAEDATLSYRLRRAPDRNVIYFDRAGLDSVEAAWQLNAMRKRFRKHEYVDPASPDYKKQFNPMNPMEDIFLPTRDGDNTRVETLAGSGSVGEVYDMEHFRDAFFGSARVPKAYFGFEGDINCIARQTRIALLDGRVRTLGQIIDTYEATGNLPWVYSYDPGTRRVVPGEVTWVGMTRRDAAVVEVELDDGSKHVCTPDHVWYVMDGKPITRGPRSARDATHVNEVEAGDLAEGMQLVPLRRGLRILGGNRSRYETVTDPFGGSEFTHRRVISCVTELAERWDAVPGPNCDHIDEDRFNNDPRNIRVISASTHMTRHAQRRVDEGRVVAQCQFCGSPIDTVCSRVDDGRAKFCSVACRSSFCTRKALRDCRYCGNSFSPPLGKRHIQEFCSRGCSNTYRNKLQAGKIPVPNHTVVAVRRLSRRLDTGCLSVAKHGNFFIADASSGGVLVHNSKATLMQQDVRFARSVKRGQTSLLRGLRSLVDTHLVLLETPGEGDKYGTDYLVKMSPISYLDEFERLELMRLRFEIVQQMNTMAAEMQIDARVWAIYLLTNFAKLPEEVVLKLVKKTPEEAPLVGGEPAVAAGGGEEFEALSPEQKEQILDTKHKAWLGTTNFTLAEAQAAAQAVHKSPGLRRSLGIFAEYHSDDHRDAMLYEQQVDRTLLPPVGIDVKDDFEEDDKAKQLADDREEAEKAAADKLAEQKQRALEEVQ